jgi:hypothetical protein
MLNWLHQRREGRAQAKISAQALVDAHGPQARFVLRQSIQDRLDNGQPVDDLWAVLRALRKIDGSNGLDSATAFLDGR